MYLYRLKEVEREPSVFVPISERPLPCEKGFLSVFFFDIFKAVRVACQSRKKKTRLTSDANDFANAKAIPERNLCSQGK